MYYIQFRSSAARVWYCAIAGFPKALVGKAVYVLSILLQVYHTPIQVDCHRDTRRRRDGGKQSRMPCLPFPLDSTDRMVDCRCLKIPLMYNGYTQKGAFQLTALEQVKLGP